MCDYIFCVFIIVCIQISNISGKVTNNFLNYHYFREGFPYLMAIEYEGQPYPSPFRSTIYTRLYSDQPYRKYSLCLVILNQCC